MRTYIPSIAQDIVRPGLLGFSSQRAYQAREIAELVPDLAGYNYLEPCVGAGTVIFTLMRMSDKPLQYCNKIILSDINSAFIDLYDTITYSSALVITVLEEIEGAYLQLESYSTKREFYNAIRHDFNLTGSRHSDKDNRVVQAARLLWLDTYSNGWHFRTNKYGHFNLPAVKSDQVWRTLSIPKIIETVKMIQRYRNRLEFKHERMEVALSKLEHKTFIYLDPPKTSIGGKHKAFGVAPRLDTPDTIRLLSILTDLDTTKHKLLATNISPPSAGLSTILKDVYIAMMRKYHFYRLEAPRIKSSKIIYNSTDDLIMSSFKKYNKEEYVYNLEKV